MIDKDKDPNWTYTVNLTVNSSDLNLNFSEFQYAYYVYLFDEMEIVNKNKLPSSDISFNTHYLCGNKSFFTSPSFTINCTFDKKHRNKKLRVNILAFHQTYNLKDSITFEIICRIKPDLFTNANNLINTKSYKVSTPDFFVGYRNKFFVAVGGNNNINKINK
jgi:hypothetical protein